MSKQEVKRETATQTALDIMIGRARTRQTHPNFPSISQTMYVARDVVECLGRKWNGEPKSLKHIPDHHKAMLMGTGKNRGTNTWCVSKEGVILLFERFYSGDPQASCDQSCVKGARVSNNISVPVEDNRYV